MRRFPLLLALLSACPGSPIETGEPPPRDADGDGFFPPEDCNDTDRNIYPGAPEACDGVDTDCDGILLDAESDADQDGEPDCTTCVEAGLWEATAPLEGQALADLLREQTSGFDTCNYSQTTSFMFLNLDGASGEVECVYTGRITEVDGEKPDAETDMNTEHAWPQSQGADVIPRKCDLHHLFPSDVEANQKRSSHPFGVVTGPIEWSEGGSTLGEGADGDLVFEPRAEKRGDVARAMLFFEVRYELGMSEDQRALFEAWHLADPPSPGELERTRAIGERQVGPNPLVVCPSVATRL